MLSSGWFPGVWILYADISEHSVCSIFIGRYVQNDKIWEMLGFWYGKSLARAKTFPLSIPQHFSNLVILHIPAYEDRTECSETSVYKIQTSGNYPEENIQHSEHGENLKSKMNYFSFTRQILKINFYNNNCLLSFVCVSK